MPAPDARPLDLVPLEALVGEILARADLAVIALAFELGRGAMREHRRTKGPHRYVQGLAMGVVIECEAALGRESTQGHPDD